MGKVTLKTICACVAVASLCATTATFAQGGGNGNGGSGGGAATSVMTYHGEPVSSPWGAEPGRMTKNAGMAETGMRSMSPDEGVMPAKPAK